MNSSRPVFLSGPFAEQNPEEASIERTDWLFGKIYWLSLYAPSILFALRNSQLREDFVF
jgi:hypothetical protein